MDKNGQKWTKLDDFFHFFQMSQRKAALETMNKSKVTGSKVNPAATPITDIPTQNLPIMSADNVKSKLNDAFNDASGNKKHYMHEVPLRHRQLILEKLHTLNPSELPNKNGNSAEKMTLPLCYKNIVSWDCVNWRSWTHFGIFWMTLLETN